MLRDTPPEPAVGLLLSMAQERIFAVLQGMASEDISRLLPAMGAEHRTQLLAALTPESIGQALLLLPDEQAAAWLEDLPEDDRLPIVRSLPEDTASPLMERLEPTPEPPPTVEEPPPEPAPTPPARPSPYLRGVVEALGRTNVTVTWPDGAPTGVVLVHVFGRAIALSAVFLDSGSLSTRDMQRAQNAAIDLQAGGALVVTNSTLSEEIRTYRMESRRQGWVIDAVTWVDRRHDGLLQRALVALIR